jgi:hypothetical protein
MVRAVLRFAPIAVVIAVVAGCVYVPPVNERPRARISEESQGPYGMGEPITLSADKSTDDGDAVSLRVNWQARSCNEDGQECSIVPVSAPGTGIVGAARVTPDRKGVLEVLLTVTDGPGASETVDLRIPIVNRQPTLVTQVRGITDPGASGGHVLGLPVTIAAVSNDPDGDPIELSWEAFPPLGGGSNPDNVIFRPFNSTGLAYELIGDVAGVWEVHVTADDGLGGTTVSEETILLAPDGPPCIASTEPGTTGEETVFLDERRRFAVLSVTDALDAYPPLLEAHPLAGKTAFTWSLRSPATGGEMVKLAGSDVPEHILDPASHAPGDHLELRVEVADRVARTVPCDPDAPTCSIANDGCLQRLTWEVEVR